MLETYSVTYNIFYIPGLYFAKKNLQKSMVCILILNENNFFPSILHILAGLYRSSVAQY